MKQNAPKHFSLQILEAKHSRALGIMKPVWSTMFMKPDELFLMTLYGYSLAANKNDSIHEILSDTKNAITRVIFWDTNFKVTQPAQDPYAGCVKIWSLYLKKWQSYGVFNVRPYLNTNITDRHSKAASHVYFWAVSGVSRAVTMRQNLFKHSPNLEFRNTAPSSVQWALLTSWVVPTTQVGPCLASWEGSAYLVGWA